LQGEFLLTIARFDFMMNKKKACVKPCADEESAAARTSFFHPQKAIF